MATAICAVCGATAEVSGTPRNWKIDPDYSAIQRLCKSWSSPLESDLKGESPTGCPNLDQATALQMPRRPPRPIS
jgi:hypothetical protein